jgi:hypothetical protein
VKIRDRVRRWWNPGKWADDHAEILDPKVEVDAEKDAAAQPFPQHEPTIGLWGSDSSGPP